MKNIFNFEINNKALVHKQTTCCCGVRRACPCQECSGYASLLVDQHLVPCSQTSVDPAYRIQLLHLLELLFSASIFIKGYNVFSLNVCILLGNNARCALLCVLYLMFLSPEQQWRECQAQLRGANLHVLTCHQQRHYSSTVQQKVLFKVYIPTFFFFFLN